MNTQEIVEALEDTCGAPDGKHEWAIICIRCESDSPPDDLEIVRATKVLAKGYIAHDAIHEGKTWTGWVHVALSSAILAQVPVLIVAATEVPDGQV